MYIYYEAAPKVTSRLLVGQGILYQHCQLNGESGQFTDNESGQFTDKESGQFIGRRKWSIHWMKKVVNSWNKESGQFMG